MAKKKALIVGATGFGGLGLIELLLRHPGIEISQLVARKDTGVPISSVFPHLRGWCDLIVEDAAQARLDADIRGLEEDAAAFESVESALKQAANALHALRLERDQAIQQRGTAEHQYAQCQQLRLEQAQKQQEKSRVDADETIYGDLVRIFGKDGMQAHLIANAIPEIEDEANAILSRLTQNRTQIAIEPLRDLQSGKTKETLDIKISDEMGTRSYEMYSGGEAFRVDFAIRIALSKLLANRAGTKLKTLVIDEGFGTQDAQALEQLVDAIKAIRGDFEKILVITHLEALKDAFPVRIEVVKLPDIGSQFQVVR